MLNTKPITKERALDSAHKLIAAAFHRKDTKLPRFCIPVEPTDDDVTLTEYIEQQAIAYKSALTLIREIAGGHRWENPQKAAERFIQEIERGAP